MNGITLVSARSCWAWPFPSSGRAHDGILPSCMPRSESNAAAPFLSFSSNGGGRWAGFSIAWVIGFTNNYAHMTPRRCRCIGVSPKEPHPARACSANVTHQALSWSMRLPVVF